MNPKLFRNLLIAFLMLGMMLAFPASALAHPMGDFAISRYSRLQLLPEEVRVLYIIDMAEIPTFQAREDIDVNADGALDDGEVSAYLNALSETVQDNLDMTVNDTPVPLTLETQSIAFPEGDGGLLTTRIELTLAGAVEAAEDGWQLTYVDNNFADRLGWQEIVIEPLEGVVLLESDMPTEDLTDGLREYPEDVFLENSRAEIRFQRTELAGTAESIQVAALAETTGVSITGQEDRFAELINSQLTNPWTVFLVFLAAFGWGASHALTPGHGKTIVAAYLVGSRGSIGHALFLGLTTTVTHTLGVFVLGVITLFASRYILPEQLFPWLSVFSGVLVVAIGWSLMRGRFSNFSEPPDGLEFAPNDHGDHGEVEYVDGGFVHAHDGGPSHAHLPPSATQISWGSLFALGVSGGLIPCPSALILMLSAIAINRIGFGILLIITFSVGLAGVLTAIGILWVKARDFLDRISDENSPLARFRLQGRFVQFLPVVSAAFITIVGVVIIIRSLGQTGLI